MHAPRSDAATDWYAEVAVRVPHDDGEDLPTSASRRLETAPDVQAVEIAELRGLDPALSATVVTVAVDVTAPAHIDDATLAHRLASAPGTECVQDVGRR